MEKINVKELRQTKNQFVLNGLLSEKVVTFTPLDDGTTRLSLNLTIETDKGTFTVRGMQNSRTKAGKENGMYKAYETIAKDYVAIQNTTIPNSKNRGDDNKPVSTTVTRTREEANYVSIMCDVRENLYPRRDGSVAEDTVYQLSKCNRITKGNEEYPIGFKGVLEGCVGAINKEIDKGNETGRLNMLLYTVNYSGRVAPVTVAVDEEIADVIEENYHKGDTVTVDIEVIRKHIGKVAEEPKKAMIAKKNVETVHFVEGKDVDEFNLISADYPETEADLILNPQLIGEAITERDNRIAEIKNNNKVTTTPVTPMAQMEAPAVDVADIPF